MSQSRGATPTDVRRKLRRRQSLFFVGRFQVPFIHSTFLGVDDAPCESSSRVAGRGGGERARVDGQDGGAPRKRRSSFSSPKQPATAAGVHLIHNQTMQTSSSKPSHVQKSPGVSAAMVSASAFVSSMQHPTDGNICQGWLLKKRRKKMQGAFSFPVSIAEAESYPAQDMRRGTLCSRHKG